MDTQQLMCAIQSDLLLKRHVSGVFPVDQLPETGHFPCGGIINNQPAHKSGKHWIAFWFDKDKTGEFFDSAAHPPEYYSPNLLIFMKKNSKKFTFNDKQLQDNESATCGHYCLFYLYMKCRGKTLKEILQNFDCDLLLNDKLVHKFVLLNFPCTNLWNVLCVQSCKNYIL